MAQKDDDNQNSNWLFSDFSSEELEEYELKEKRFHEEQRRKEENEKLFQKACLEIFHTKNPDDLIKKALEWVPMILSDNDMKIVQKYAHKWLQKDGNISLAEFDQAKNALTNQKNVGIFASIINIISEAKNSQNNKSCNFQNMTKNTQLNTNEDNENLPTWFDEDVSTTSKELSEWLQPGPDYVPPTAESEEEFRQKMDERRRVIIYLYKNLGIKAVVNFLWEEQTMYDMGDFTFFDQISKSDLHTIYQFAERYMKLSTKKLEWKEKYQNEVEKMNFYESVRKITESAAFLHLLLLTRQEIDDISKYF